MYQFSRSIYRELAPKIADTTGASCASRQHILDACEGTMRRLLTDRRYFARPTKALFTELRGHFPIGEQLFVFQVVDRECKAHTRRGTPCQREPLPGRDYCPSHKHLEEDVVIDTEEIREEELQLVA
jgi:hypothetical protein